MSGGRIRIRRGLVELPVEVEQAVGHPKVGAEGAILGCKHLLDASLDHVALAHAPLPRLDCIQLMTIGQCSSARVREPC